MSTTHATLGLTLLLTLTATATACRTQQGEPASGQAGAAPAPASSAAAPTPDAAAPNQAPNQAAPSEAPPDPEREAQLADQLADLEDMCLALNRDYSDGTLGDYYGKLQPRTDWAKQQIAVGNESMKPGRLLEQAIKDLAPEAPPASCQKLLDYLDDVE